MLTNDDKKFIVNTINHAITNNNQILVKEMVELFNATNNRIDQVEKKLGNKIDKLAEQVKDHNDILDTHERRIEKLEEKVFTTTTIS